MSGTTYQQDEDRRAERVEVFVDAQTNWRWRRVAGNNQIIATSGEGYTDLEYTRGMAERLNPGVPIEVVED